MPHKLKAAIDASRQADEAARAAEQQLQAAWHAFEVRAGPQPTGELIARVAALRAVATERLSSTIEAITPAR